MFKVYSNVERLRALLFTLTKQKAYHWIRGKLKLGGKHKRGELGSVEEEQTCKRSNMASEESESIDEDTNITEAQEPTLLELKEMLVDIKIELSTIVRENNKLAKEMAGLTNTIQEQKIELDSLKSLITKAEKGNIIYHL